MTLVAASVLAFAFAAYGAYLLNRNTTLKSRLDLARSERDAIEERHAYIVTRYEEIVSDARRQLIEERESQRERVDRLQRFFRQDRARLDTRIQELIRQAQSMAERIVDLRVERGLEGGDPKETFFADSEEYSPPYSESLLNLLNAIESDEARLIVEEQIEQLRETGMFDDQIAQRLKRDGTIG